MNTTQTFALPMMVAIYGMAVADPNLLPNGEFSSQQQVTSWTSSDTLVWSSDDASGNVTSGSLALSATAITVGGMGTALSSCFHVNPGASYSYGGQSRSATSGAIGLFHCRAFSDAACAVLTASLDPNPGMSHTSTWAIPASTEGTLPMAAHSVSCALASTGGGTSQSPPEMHFDNLFFNSAAPPVPVRLQEFNVD